MESVGMGSTGEVPTYLLSTEQAPIMEEEQDEGGLEDILQVFKIFKLARVLKLARHSPGLQVIVNIRAMIQSVTSYCQAQVQVQIPGQVPGQVTGHVPGQVQ